MKQTVGIKEAVQRVNGGYDVVPANIMLAGAEQELLIGYCYDHFCAPSYKFRNIFFFSSILQEIYESFNTDLHKSRNIFFVEI